MLQTVRHRGRLSVAQTAIPVLIAVHGVILYYFSSHMTLSVAVIVGVIAMVVVKHLGLLGPLYALLRKALRRPK